MTRAGALLFLGDYGGTLAAARCLGRRGIDVALADSARFSRTAASRFVSHRLASPAPDDGPALVRWLLDAPDPALDGRVLFPASDDLVFLFAQHRTALAARYRLLIPSIDRVAAILNKRRLYDVCRLIGVRHPQTWFPEDETHLRRLLPDIDCDVVVKPKIQVQFRSGQKGAEVRRGGDLVSAFRAFIAANPYGAEVRAHNPDVAVPMVQAFHEEAISGIVSVAGFAAGSGSVPAVRAARKILQRPRRLGVGVCFEATEIDSGLPAQLGQLCEALGYTGIFEMEFIEHSGELLLIDFNPRGYGQMAFEDARGLPLPYLHYLGAVGDHAQLAAEYARARQRPPRAEGAFCHGTLLALVRGAQWAARAFGRPAEPWAVWRARQAACLTDAVAADDDPGPHIADAWCHTRDFLRHPRSFARSLQRG